MHDRGIIVFYDRFEEAALWSGWLTGGIDDWPDDLADDDEVDPDRLAGCAYWRCGELFETRSANHRFCRKACRSRQQKWERAQARRHKRETRRRG